MSFVSRKWSAATQASLTHGIKDGWRITKADLLFPFCANVLAVRRRKKIICYHQRLSRSLSVCVIFYLVFLFGFFVSLSLVNCLSISVFIELCPLIC